MLTSRMFWLCSKMHLWSWGHDYLGQPALEKHVVVIFFKHISCVQGSFKSTFHNQTWLYRPLCQHTHAVFRMWPQGSSIRKTRKRSLPTGNNPAPSVPEKQGCWLHRVWLLLQTTGAAHCPTLWPPLGEGSVTILGVEGNLVLCLSLLN